MPRGKRSDWIFINVFFLLIYRKRKFCAEPIRERLTFHFELRTRSGNFRFFFFSSFLLSFCFFQIKARSRLVTAPLDLTMIWGCYVISACLRACFVLFVGVCIIYFVFWHITKSLKRAGSYPRVVRFVGFWVLSPELQSFATRCSPDESVGSRDNGWWVGCRGGQGGRSGRVDGWLGIWWGGG